MAEWVNVALTSSHDDMKITTKLSGELFEEQLNRSFKGYKEVYKEESTTRAV